MIRLQDINREFHVGHEAVHALRDVNVDVHPGEYIAVMGPSGAGKSTLLNILGLLDRPDKGTYLLDEMNTIDLSDDEQASVRRHKIGFVFQFFHLVARLTTAENVGLPLVLAGVEPAARVVRVREALSALGLSDRANHRPDQLSGGQRQRVAIARATIMKPRVILADEPTGNLDRTSGEEVIGILEQLNNNGMTLIMVTHNLELGSRAPRKIDIVDGRIVADTGAISRHES